MEKTHNKMKENTYYSRNIEKNKADAKKYYEINKDKVKNRVREYKIRNKDLIQNYYINNKERLKKEKAFTKKVRMKNDIGYRLKGNIRSTFINILKRRLGGAEPKTRWFEQYIGCTFEFYKTYIENKFEEGMTWDNHSINGWNIDHIIPVNSFNFLKDEDIKKCMHYSNTQPLWAKDNRSKAKSNQSKL
jgi:hypothetical protein